MIKNNITRILTQILFALVFYIVSTTFIFANSKKELNQRYTIFANIERLNINHELIYNSDLEIYIKGDTIDHIYISRQSKSEYLYNFTDSLNIIHLDGNLIISKDKKVSLRDLAEESNWVLNPYFNFWELNSNIDTVYKIDIPDSLFYEKYLYDTEFISYKINIESKSGQVSYKRIDENDTLIMNAHFSWYTSDVYNVDSITNRYHKVNKLMNPNYDSLSAVNLWIGDDFDNRIPITDLYGRKTEYRPAMTKKNILTVGFLHCSPCILIKPLLDSLHKSGTYNVQYLSTDFPTEKIMDYDQHIYDEYDFSFDFGYVEKGLFADQLLQYPPLPFTIIMDANGVVQSIVIGFDEERLYKMLSN